MAVERITYTNPHYHHYAKVSHVFRVSSTLHLIEIRGGITKATNEQRVRVSAVLRTCQSRPLAVHMSILHHVHGPASYDDPPFYNYTRGCLPVRLEPSWQHRR
jgi:hypothetical protein